MIYRNIVFTLAVATLFLSVTSGNSHAGVTSSDITRLKQKAANQEMLTAADIALAEEINATTDSWINIKRAVEQARTINPPLQVRPRPRYTLDDYVWLETAYNWVDISEVGTPSGVTGDDSNGGPFDLGFDFPYYDSTYSSIRICTNGWVSFTSTVPEYWNGAIPNPVEPNNALYGFWDELTVEAGIGEILYYQDTENERFIVNFHLRHLGDLTMFEFQIILYANGDIVYQYQSLPESLNSCTIGIENYDGTEALQVLFDGVGTEPSAGWAMIINQPDGVPAPVTNLTATEDESNVTLSWSDPTQDTYGNPLTIDNVQVWLGQPVFGTLLGTVIAGTQAFTHMDAPAGIQVYAVRAFADPYFGEVESVSVIVGDPTYAEDFEISDGMWVPEPAVGEWEWGSPTAPAGPADAHSGDNVWGTVLSGNYEAYTCCFLTLNLGLEVESTDAMVEFWGWYDIEPLEDGCNFKISTDNGNTWETVSPEAGYPGITNNSNLCIPMDEVWNNHEQGYWEHINIPIGQYIGEVPIFRFVFGSDAINNYTGFYFDDFTIRGLEELVRADVSGTITLDGGNGDITQAVVRADGLGHHITSPAADGTYTLEDVVVGERLIWVYLENYQNDSITIILPDGGLNGVDLTLVREDPPVPTGLDTSWVDHVNGQVRLEWNMSPDLLVDAYNVYRKIRDDNEWIFAAQVAGRENTFHIDALPGSGIWNYAVTAVDNDASTPVESDYSAYVEIIYGELPPLMLAADGDFDDHIHLSWLAPGTPPEFEIYYDDGTNESDGIGWWYFTPAFGWLITRFQSVSGPLTVTRLKFYFTSFAVDGDAIEVGVFADDGSGSPTFDPLGVITTTREAPFDDWQEFELDTPLTFADGIFYAGVRQITSNSLCLGIDEDTPFVYNTFYYSTSGDFWYSYEPDLLSIPMQRAFVIGNAGEEITMAPSSPRGPTAVRTGININPFTDENGRWMEEAYRASIPRTKAEMTREDRLAMIHRPQVESAVPHIQAVARGNRGHSLDDSYYIYRDGVFLDQTEATAYDDFVEENIFFDYYVTAYYDVGGESGPTGTVTAAASMAPGMPAGINGESTNATDLLISWIDPTTNRDGSPLIDLTNINIYRDGLFIGTVMPGIGEYIDTPPRSNRTYTWSVAAADEVSNEGPRTSWTGSVILPWMEWPYEWVDITESGTSLTMELDDNQGPFDLGFDFEFYGNTYDAVRVCSNGWLSFTSLATTYVNNPIPDPFEPNNAIYVFWDDMDVPMAIDGGVYYYADADNGRFIVTWDEIPHWSTTDYFTYQVILDADNAIYYNYQTIPFNYSCTIGVENLNGSEGIQVVYNGLGDWLPSNGTTLTFWGPEPVYTDVSGTITLDGGAGDVTEVDVTANGISNPHANPDATGAFLMEDVQVGNRRFTAELNGYHPAEVIREVPEEGLTDVDITLVRLDPPVPTGLTASVVNATGVVTLEWDSSADPLVDAYNVYRRVQTEADWTLILTVSGTDTTDLLTADDIYLYGITAVDSDVSTPVESYMSDQVQILYGAIPPVGLMADGNYDDQIVLSWLEPGFPPETEVFYDDGTNEIEGLGWPGVSPPFGWMVARYQSISGPLEVTRLKFFITGLAVDGDPFEVGLFADDGTGLPTFEPLGVITVEQEPPYDGWREFELTSPLPFQDGIFYAAVRQITSNMMCIGGDETTPFINNTFFYSYGGFDWSSYEPSVMTIPMQRAFVTGNAGQEIELFPSPPRGPVAQHPRGGFENVSKSSGTAQTVFRTDGKLRAAVRTAPTRKDKVKERDSEFEARLTSGAEPQIIGNNTPSVENALSQMHRRAAGNDRRPVRTLDDLIAYRVYKDGVEIGSTDYEIRTYTDTPVAENEPHNYYVTAVYDDGSESVPSNTISARCNMAPGAPLAVNGTPQGTMSMVISWDDPAQNADGSPCVDLAMLQIFRDSQWIANVAPGTEQHVDTPPSNYQVYTWTVYARDEVPNTGDGFSFTGSVQSPWEVAEYEWIDISEIGTPTGQRDDSNVGPYNLGFNFEFYGTTYNSVRICDNGFLSFTSTVAPYSNVDIPSLEEPNNSIYPFWDDLNPEQGGTILYYSDTVNDRFIVSFEGIPHYFNSGSNTFQIILMANGGIHLNYQYLNYNNSCTIGAENADGTDALRICCNGSGVWLPLDMTAIELWGGPSGELVGEVRETPGLEPVGGVIVTALETGDVTITNASGNYLLPLEPDTYTVCFTKPGLCKETYEGVVILDNNTTVRDAAMAQAGVEFDLTSIDVIMLNEIETQTFHITNTGNCDIGFEITCEADWCTCDPQTGTVLEGNTAPVEASMNAVGMPGGEYITFIEIQHEAAAEPYLIAVHMYIPTDVVIEQDDFIPTEFALHQNYPNPFNPSTTLRFDVAKERHVRIVVFNVLGQEVARPVDAVLPAGRHKTVFTARDLPSGMYLVKMNAGGFSALNKMVLLK